MSPLFGKANPEKAIRLEQIHRDISQQYDAMVRESLNQLTSWAFPNSHVEDAGAGKWQLVHTTAEGSNFLDLTVTLEFKGERSVGFSCDYSRSGIGRSIFVPSLDREGLEDALRRCLASR